MKLGGEGMQARGFTIQNPFRRVYHIRDGLDAHMTLLVGDREALLFDTGYGLANLPQAVRAITSLPLSVVLSHGHYDHVLGSRWFPTVYLSEEEMDNYGNAMGNGQRERVLARADERGFRLTPAETEAYSAFSAPKPQPLPRRTFDLGGLHVRVWPMPGHTRGSTALYVEELRLLLPGDNLNPVVWLFFDDRMPLAQYAATMRTVLYLPFAHALCPHDDRPVKRAEAEAFVDGLTPATFRKARPVRIPPYLEQDTRECSPARGFKLIFNAQDVATD